MEKKYVVRVGGRSKSPELEECNLRVRSQNSFTKRQGYKFFQLKKACGELEQSISELQKRRSTLSRGQVTEEMLELYATDGDELVEEIKRAAFGGADDWGDEDDENDNNQFVMRGGFPRMLSVWRRGDDLATRTDLSKGEKAHERHERSTRLENAIAECERQILRQLRRETDKYLERVSEIKRLDDASKLDALRSAKIVAFTTSGAAKYDSLLRALRPRVVVCEEVCSFHCFLLLAVPVLFVAYLFLYLLVCSFH